MQLSEIKKIKSNEGHDNEEDRKEYDHPTTSKEDTLNPEQNSHNMNDLQALDFNSADEIRQAMKAIISGNIPQSSYEEIDCQTFKIDQRSSLTSPIETIDIQKHYPGEMNLRKDKRESDNVSRVISNPGKGNRKRPGRPPRADPSKKMKKENIADMYLGKLSNVVPFRHNQGSYNYDSDTDVDTVYIFY